MNNAPFPKERGRPLNARATLNRSVRALVAALFVAALFVTGCGGPGASPEPEGPVLQPADAARAASLSGKVSYDGPAPSPSLLSMDSDPACKARADAARIPELATDADGGLQNVVVWIRQGLPAGRYVPPSGSVTIDQDGCLYRPRVAALMIGQTLEITNHDETTHNIHLQAKQNRQWNRSQFAGAIPVRETFGHEEVAIPIGCNVHPWMKAWVAVLRHPFFAVSAPDGSFHIDGIPPGEYTVGAWHEKLGTLERHVTLAEHSAMTTDFTFRPSGGA